MPLARGGCVASFVLTLRHHYGLSIVIPAYVTKATHVVLFLSALMPCISYLELSLTSSLNRFISLFAPDWPILLIPDWLR